MGQGIHYGPDEHLGGDRLDQIAVELPNRVDRCIKGRESSEDDHGGIRVALFDRVREFDAAPVGQSIVDNRDRRKVDGLEAKRVVRGTGIDRSDPRRLEHLRKAFAQRFVVIDNEDDLAVLGYERRWVMGGVIPAQAAPTASISCFGGTGFFRYLKTLVPSCRRRSTSKS
jgi:hypothetical protein